MRDHAPGRRPSVGVVVVQMGTFPFARQGDEDMKNAKALQMMFGRIIKADYEEPDEVSEECRDLLRGLLKADPAKRLTVSQVRLVSCEPILLSS